LSLKRPKLVEPVGVGLNFESKPKAIRIDRRSSRKAALSRSKLLISLLLRACSEDNILFSFVRDVTCRLSWMTSSSRSRSRVESEDSLATLFVGVESEDSLATLFVGDVSISTIAAT